MSHVCAPDPTAVAKAPLVARPAPSLEARAEAFAEDCLRLGLRAEDVMRRFRSPQLTDVHRLWRRLGDEQVSRLVWKAALVWASRGPR